jgi:hypothetical protein
MLHLPHPRTALLALLVIPLAVAPPLAGARRAPVAAAPRTAVLATAAATTAGESPPRGK